MSDSLHLVKGHGTENDFLLLPDFDGERDLTAAQVAALCDRRAGLGADGILRVVRTRLAPDAAVAGLADRAPFFMDYRNADGSISEMCGNGVRVFARFLRQEGLITDTVAVATRGGIKYIDFAGDQVRVDMGPAVIRGEQPVVDAPGMRRPRTAIAVDMPNPHVVVLLDDLSELDALDLSAPPTVTPPLPAGQNVEFIVPTATGRLRMRVHERGSGETRSCGTGICAVVAAAPLLDASLESPDGDWQVDVPGGTCRVGASESGSTILTGPAVLVAQVEVSWDWLDSVSS